MSKIDVLQEERFYIHLNKHAKALAGFISQHIKQTDTKLTPHELWGFCSPGYMTAVVEALKEV